jgi:hypothetical protein
MGLLDLDEVADPLSMQRTDERMRLELEQALLNLLLASRWRAAVGAEWAGAAGSDDTLDGAVGGAAAD